jgi:PAS domain S-box-containing protein
MGSMPFAAWFKDENGLFTQVNEVFLCSMGKQLSQVIGQGDSEVFDQAEARLIKEGELEVKRTGKSSESTYSRKKRIIKTVQFPVRDEQGRVIGTGGYREDITNLTDSLQSLHRERETLEVLLETMPFCIFFTDRHHRYIRVNRMMAKLLRVSRPDKAAGKTNKVFFTKRVARRMMEEDRDILETGNPIVNKIVYFEDDGVDGFWMEKNKIPIRDERGVITMIMGIFKDVSDLMLIENELKEAKERAEESDRLKTSFLANMSHEIRTPMNGIIGFANLLRDPGLTEEKKDLFLKHIDQSSSQLLNIIDDIIDISKIESGQMKISNKPVRINGILEEIYSSFFHSIRGDGPGEKKVTFNLKKGNLSHDFTLVTDYFRLRQIFNNLIGNAIKFTKEGHITFGYELKNRHVEFFVSDSGIGIPNNQIKLIFDRFGQVNQERSLQPSGTGLGLPISRSLVNLMGGEMWVKSDVGKGCTFYFTLPLVIEEPVEEVRVLISNKSYNWSNKQILVAEDEELNWMFVREMLRQTGATIHRARNGHEVVEQTRKLVPHAILMDIKMPEMSGIDAARKIREFNSSVPIIAQSAFVMAEEKEECLRAGCNHFVTKPLDRTTIMELIDSYFK